MDDVYYTNKTNSIFRNACITITSLVLWSSICEPFIVAVSETVCSNDIDTDAVADGLRDEFADGGKRGVKLSDALDKVLGVSIPE